jgi:hypothetical protein
MEQGGASPAPTRWERRRSTARPPLSPESAVARRETGAWDGWREHGGRWDCRRKNREKAKDPVGKCGLSAHGQSNVVRHMSISRCVLTYPSAHQGSSDAKLYSLLVIFITSVYGLTLNEFSTCIYNFLTRFLNIHKWWAILARKPKWTWTSNIMIKLSSSLVFAQEWIRFKLWELDERIFSFLISWV